MKHAENTSRRAFTLVEILVVIAIIAVLMGVLIAAMSGVTDATKATKTKAQMTALVDSIEKHRLQHRKLPGPIPELILAYHNHEAAHGSGEMMISSTENILLGLMGGYRIQDGDNVEGQGYYDDLLATDGWFELQLDAPNNQTFTIKLNPSHVGNGPVVDGIMYDPISSGLEIGFNEISKQYGYKEGDVNLPDVLDGWGNPIVSFKRGNTLGQLVGDAHDDGVQGPQFFVESGWSYTRANYQHLENACSDTENGSLLSTGYPDDPGDSSMGAFSDPFSTFKETLNLMIMIWILETEFSVGITSSSAVAQMRLPCRTGMVRVLLRIQLDVDGPSWNSLLSMEPDEFQTFNDIIMKR